MSKINALVDESDVVKLILEFLESRRLYISQFGCYTAPFESLGRGGARVFSLSEAARCMHRSRHGVCGADEAQKVLLRARAVERKEGKQKRLSSLPLEGGIMTADTQTWRFSNISLSDIECMPPSWYLWTRPSRFESPVLIITIYRPFSVKNDALHLRNFMEKICTHPVLLQRMGTEDVVQSEKCKLSLERETGVINGCFSDDALFLRQLILDGQWDTVIDFIEPLKASPQFNTNLVHFLIYKYKYFELLCIKLEPGPMKNNQFTVAEVVECLRSIEAVCPKPEEYNELCALLTLSQLSESETLRHWNPSSARMECFQAIYPLVHAFMPVESDKQLLKAANNDRLVQLLLKGLLYETAVEFCQNRAFSDKTVGDVKVDGVLDGYPLDSVDASLLAWLEQLSPPVFKVPFEQKNLNVQLTALKRPELQAHWTQQILLSPIVPQKFPFTAVPLNRIRSAEKMSRSLLPYYDGLTSGLGAEQNKSPSKLNPLLLRPKTAALSHSFAMGFQITGRPFDEMQQSAIDMLLESSSETSATRKETADEKGSSAASNSGGGTGPESRRGDSRPAEQVHSPITEEEEVESEKSPESVARSRHEANASGRSSADETAHNAITSAITTSCSTRASAAVPQRDTEGGRLCEYFSLQQRDPAQRRTSETAGKDAERSVTYQMMHMSYYADKAVTAAVPKPSSVKLRTKSWKSKIDVTPNSSGAFKGGRFSSADIDKEATRISTVKTKESSVSSPNVSSAGGRDKRVKFIAVNRLEDVQAIRTAAFHPSGRFFAVGTNSRQLHICRYPALKSLRYDHVAVSPEIVLSRPKQHRGSVYCTSFNPTGELLATGSNDKTIRLMHFHAESCKIDVEHELAIHDGTVRDLIFMEDTSNHTSLLISGGAGNCHIQITDCASGTSIRELTGHTAPVLGLYTWGGCMFVSCSQDKTVRFWDLRCDQSVNMIAPGSKTCNSPVTSVCVDPSGRLLVSGHEDASIMFYDIQGSRVVQLFRPHTDDVRTVRFSPGTYYLLSGSYDKHVIITDMRGDLMEPLKYLPVAQHEDKVIQCRWHPHDFTFLSTSADRSMILWALPPPNMP